MATQLIRVRFIDRKDFVKEEMIEAHTIEPVIVRTFPAIRVGETTMQEPTRPNGQPYSPPAVHIPTERLAFTYRGTEDGCLIYRELLD